MIREEMHLVPFSLVGLAEIELLQEHWADARSYFKQAKKYRHYDYENWAGWYLLLFFVYFYQRPVLRRIKRGQDKVKAKA